MNDVDGRAVAIGALQGYATGPLIDAGIQPFPSKPPTGKHVAVVGGGPAGLACAAELQRRGHTAVVFDAADEPGGLNTHGVAEYKVPHEAALAEIAWIEAGGVEIRRNALIADASAFDSLLDGYDAVFVGVGLGRIRPLQLPGEDLQGVHDALALIAASKAEMIAQDLFRGQTVVVLGGGNTAIDAARLATRLAAARVSLVYRRGPDHMPAYRHEIDEARAEGVTFSFWLSPVGVEGEGAVASLRCERTAPGVPGTDGRPSVVGTGETELVPCDVVIVATGQETHAAFLESAALDLDASGRVVTDDHGRTSRARVWAGGDCVNGGKEVVNAVAEGMAAARSIDDALSGRR